MTLSARDLDKRKRGAVRKAKRLAELALRRNRDPDLVATDEIVRASTEVLIEVVAGGFDVAPVEKRARRFSETKSHAQIASLIEAERAIHANPMEIVSVHDAESSCITYIRRRRGLLYVGKTSQGIYGRYPYAALHPDFQDAVCIECSNDEEAHALEGAIVHLMPEYLDNRSSIACRTWLRRAWLCHPKIVWVQKVVALLALLFK